MLLTLLMENFQLLITILIGLVTFYLVRFYVKVYSLPQGPFPLPLLGNILLFRKTKVNQFITINDLHKKFGKVFTLWIGNKPNVIIGDFELTKNAFNSKNNELMGRPIFSIRKYIRSDGAHDVIFSDYGPIWASLRRVAHSAVRKLSITDKFGNLVDEVVEESVKLMIEKNGYNKAFSPNSFIYITVFNIIASSTFGKRYEWNDEELKFLENSFEYLRKNSSAIALPEMIPFLKPFYYKKIKEIRKVVFDLASTVKNKYKTHLKDYQKGVIRDFCDALIEAKEEAILEEKESAPYLKDSNLAQVILNIFNAGSDTTQYTMRWIILLMANNTQMQIKMKNEINIKIGDRIPTHEDRQHCPYVSAFIAEALRYRGVAPFAVPHKAMVDYKLGDHLIPKDCTIFSNLLFNNFDPRLWSEPEEFRPERFLTKDGKFNASITGYAPFGIGRRVCLGEKLALVGLFLITVKLLKSLPNGLIELPGGVGSADLEPNPNIMFLSTPKPYEIMFRKM